MKPITQEWIEKAEGDFAEARTARLACQQEGNMTIRCGESGQICLLINGRTRKSMVLRSATRDLRR